MAETHPCVICGQPADFTPPQPANATCTCRACSRTYFMTGSAWAQLEARGFTFTPEQRETLKQKVARSKVFLGSDERPFRRLDFDAL